MTDERKGDPSQKPQPDHDLPSGRPGKPGAPVHPDQDLPRSDSQAPLPGEHRRADAQNPVRNPDVPGPSFPSRPNPDQDLPGEAPSHPGQPGQPARPEQPPAVPPTTPGTHPEPKK